MKEMRHCQYSLFSVLLLLLAPMVVTAAEAISIGNYTLASGHSSLEGWVLPEPSHPANNAPSNDRIELGRALFFDVRLSGRGDMSCGSCHNPKLGWSDGLDVAEGANGKSLKRATPTIINSAYNYLYAWDGRFESLEAQVISPFISKDEMNVSAEQLTTFLENDPQYSEAFSRAYPREGVNIKTLSKAIATFERTVTSVNSPFDQWVQGKSSAMTESQVKGFEVFLDPNKGNCVVCHAPPNFSDNGFHNIGIESGRENPDDGRFEWVPVPVMQGAFKTPTLRDIQITQPYFHNGSAQTLMDVLDHYALVGDINTFVSPSLKRVQITNSEREHLLDFLNALTDKKNKIAQDPNSNAK